MTQATILVLFSFLSLYFKLVVAQTTVPSTINQNQNKFFRSGTAALAVSSSTTATNLTTTVTYATPLFSSSYQIMSSITTINNAVDSSNPTVNYNITIIRQNITMFQVRLYSVVLSRISIAKLTYFCVDRAIRDLQFYVIDVYFGDGKPGLLAGTSTNTDFIYNFTARISRSLIVLTNTYIVEPFIKGCKIINWNSLTYSIQLSATVLNTTHFRIDIKSSTFFSQQVTDLYAEVLVYNVTQVGSHVTLLNRCDITLSSTAQNYNSFGSYRISQNNFYLGIKGFRFLFTYNFQYDLIYDFALNQVVINAISTSLEFITTTALNVELRQCLDPVHPYFMNWTYRCHSSCPIERRYADELRKQCAWCMHDCYTCDNGFNCSSCNTTHYFRENDLRDSGILRCKPISGYYSTRWNDTYARKCDVSCVECILQPTNCSTCKPNQYLARLNYNGICNPCPIHCSTCIDDLKCTSCDKFYGIDSVSMCVPICTQNCSICHIATTPFQTSICDTCKVGYDHNLTQPSECHTICGDGIFIEGYEKCDDNNNQNGDGCSSQCKVELGYNCYLDQNDYTKPQKCYYEQQVRFSLRKMRKYPKKNTFKFELSLSTLNPAVLKELDWLKIISIDIDYFTFSIINKQETYTDSYNSTIRTLVLTFEVDYKPTIKPMIQIEVDPKRNSQPLNVSQVQSQVEDIIDQYKRVSLILNPNKFDTTPTTRQILPLRSQNHLAVIYESQSFYTLAVVLQYILMAIAGISLLLMVFSFTIYGGKILTLQWLFVVNCAYFSLVGFQSIQAYSTVQALAGFKLITFNVFLIDQQETSKLWWAGISNSFTSNCLVLIAIVGLVVVYLIVMGIVSSKIKDPKSIKKFDIFKKHYGTEEIGLTLYMIGAYGLTINLFLSISGLVKGTHSDVIGLVLGTLILIFGFIMFMMAIKKKNLLWQFKDHFYLNTIQQYYINFAVLIVWVNSIFLVALRDTAFGNIIPILLSILWIVFLVVLKPFKKNSQRKRPIVVQVFNILVQAIFMTLKIQLTNNDQLTQTSAFFLYLPFVLAIVLTLGLGHTIFCFIKKMKNAIIDRREFLQNQKLYQITTQMKCPHQTITTAQSSSSQNKQQPSIEKQMAKQLDKQIMQSFRKQKGFNFISHTLEYGKEELLDKWNKLDNVSSTNTNSSVDIIKAKNMKKQIRRSLFLEGNKILPYFKFSYDPEGMQSPKKTDTKSKDKQEGLKNKLQNQQQLECSNEEKSPEQMIKTEQKTEKEINEFVTYQYETEKYKQEWKSFFKPKNTSDEQKKHSLAIYDMI